MIKLIAHVKRKAGTTREQFRAYYETNHVPLATTAMGSLVLDYHRNYINASTGYFGEGPDAGAVDGPDCVTEVLLRDQAAVDALFARMERPEISGPIIADEDKFIDRGAIRIMICEHVPDSAGLAE